jgi:neutral ceramidase
MAMTTSPPLTSHPPRERPVSPRGRDWRALFVLATAIAAAWASATEAQEVEPAGFPIETNLRAGVAGVDITPDNPTFAYGHPRAVRGVRDPIRATVLILDDGKTRAAVVTFDLLAAWDAMVAGVRTAVAEKAGVPRENILVAVSHNHSGPDFEKQPEWAEAMLLKLGGAVEEAARSMAPASIGYGEGTIGFSINRRKVYNGKAVVSLNPDGPNDRRVKVLRFDDGEGLTPRAVIMHAVCHPCCFTWGDNATKPHPEGYPLMSADFPGEARRFVEACYDGQTRAMFLQGCAGDIRPNLKGEPYRCADEADIQWAGRDLGAAVVRALARSATREERAKRATHYAIRCARETVELPGKDGPVRAEMMAMKLGPFLLLTMPGEPMVEYGFRIERAIGDRAVPLVVGYANGSIGYIATAAAYEVGGYEPEMSKLAPDAEEIICRQLDGLADRVIGDVFRTFNKHEINVPKGQAGKP